MRSVKGNTYRWPRAGFARKGFEMFKNGEDGFTLLELIIALAVVGMILIPLLGMFTGGAFSTFRGGLETRGIILAQERMEECKFMGYAFLEEEVLAGRARVLLNDTIDSFNREVVLERMEIVTDDDLLSGGNESICIRPAGEDATTLAGIIFIKVSIAWREGGRERHVSVSSYLSQR